MSVTLVSFKYRYTKEASTHETTLCRPSFHFLSHLSYCPPVWMLYDKTLNHRDYGNNFGFFLEQSELGPVHVRNLELPLPKILQQNAI